MYVSDSESLLLDQLKEHSERDGSDNTEDDDHVGLEVTKAKSTPNSVCFPRDVASRFVELEGAPTETSSADSSQLRDNKG